MTLIEKCKNIQKRLSCLEKSRQQQELVKMLNRRADDLGVILDQFKVVLSRLGTLVELKIVSVVDLPDSEDAIWRVEAMKERLKNEPADITKGRDFNDLCNALKRVTDEGRPVADRTWNEYLKQESPVVDSTLLKQHRDSPQHAEAVNRIGELWGNVRGLVKQPPLNITSFREIQKLWEQIRKFMQQLPKCDDPEVQAFLDAVIGSDGASIELLTESVVKWLDDNKMIEEFSVRRSRK